MFVEQKCVPKKIGILDSGIGGLSILQKLITLANIEIYYVADTAHMPYGQRSQEEIQHLSSLLVKLLIEKHDVRCIIIACHTISTNALDHLKKQFPAIVFIDVVACVVERALTLTQGKIGILATQATVERATHKKQLLQYNAKLQVTAQPCFDLAYAIEHDYANTIQLKSLVQQYVAPLLAASIDTLMLSCTHYALIQQIIQDCVGPSVVIVSAEQSINIYVKGSEVQKGIVSAYRLHWIVTGNRDQFFKAVRNVSSSWSIGIDTM